MRAARTCLALAMLAGAAGCSGLKTYPNEAPKNLHVSTLLDSRVRAVLHVHEVTGACATRYEGTVTLDRPAVDVGIVAEQQAYLVVSFDTSSFMAGSRSTSVGTLLRPRSGYSYELAVSYKQDIYNVALREIDRSKGVSRELRRVPLAGC
jgi:hypothetical protein